MRKLVCPVCGRHLSETDCPPGYTILQRCPRCRQERVLRTADGKRAASQPEGRRPDPLRYR
jgi:hypothetical protein